MIGVNVRAYRLKNKRLAKKSLLYSERNHEKRIQYLRTLRKIVTTHGSDSLVYMDESGFEESSYRPHAYARQGKKIHGNRTGKRSQRTNLILARQAGKLLSPMLFTGSTNTALVNQWVESLLLKQLRPNSTLILDNAPFHNRCDLEKIVKNKKHRLLFLPPYSPDFNPIEKTFSHIKRYRQSQPDKTSMDVIIKSYGNYLE